MNWQILAASVVTLVVASQAPAWASVSSIRTGATTSTPVGHHDYCARGGRHCGKQAATAPAKMTKAKWNTLARVNASVNRSITPATDMAAFGKREHWHQSARAGDCEDYALKKRSILLGKGFKKSQLLLAKARRPNGEAHIVLVVRTNKGDYVLDNLHSKVVPWRRAGLRFQKMQAVDNASRWVAIR